MKSNSIESERRAGYVSSAVEARSGHTKEGRDAGYQSHAIGVNRGHPKEGRNAGHRSRNEPGVVRVHTVFDGSSIIKFNAYEWIPKPEVDQVSYPAFVTLAVTNAVSAPVVLTASAIIGYEFPPNPLLGAAEAAGLAAGAVGTWVAAKKFIRSELK